MEAREYLKLATDRTEAGDLIKENNLTEAVVKLMSNYAEFRFKNGTTCAHPPNQTYLNNGIWHCEKCGGKWESLEIRDLNNPLT